MIELIVCCGFSVLIIGLLFLFYLFSMYNGLISLRNNIEKAWANIDVLLKQRSDLIPNLVEAVQGYMKHEKGTLEEITRLRVSLLKASGPAEKAKASEGISSALKTLFAVAENYPKLEASKSFMKLHEQLTAMENQIADRREFYNDSVLLFNTRIHSIPDSLMAALMGFKDKEYFRATDEEKKAVPVKLE
ncbi:MAG: LemA family protein [Candidatus Micrarchaeota archaeon]